MPLRIDPIRHLDLAVYAARYDVDLPEWLANPVGYVAHDDAGEICGIGCVFHDKSGAAWIILDAPDLHGNAMILHRHALRLLQSFRSTGIRPAALRNDELEASARWLERLGFNPTGDTMNGKEVWR